jgi:hypothetical protein
MIKNYVNVDSLSLMVSYVYFLYVIINISASNQRMYHIEHLKVLGAMVKIRSSHQMCM